MSDQASKLSAIERIIENNWGNAICYSGYREGQNPRMDLFPTYDQIKEDLLMLRKNWLYIRLYDCSQHAQTTLQVIQDEELNLKVMLGAELAAEVSNPNCPWGADYDQETLAANQAANSEEIERLIVLANQYPDIVFSLAIGNEASVEWTDHMVPVRKLVSYARRVKKGAKQPITFCENYVPWTSKLKPLAAELDFLSVHTYPVWEFKSIDEALPYSQENYYAVAEQYPDKAVIITEAGWTTASNGRGIEPSNTSEELQAQYYEQLMAWTQAEKILTFVFEAFDEPWKGSPEPLEPEKHWGLFFEDRIPKLVMQELYSSRAKPKTGR